MDDDGLDDAVRHRILLVGHGYGRKTMTGLLAAAGIRVGEHRVGQSLRRVAPQHQALRAHVAYRMRNPVVYEAHHFGDKLHLDQNEKLVMYGVTEVLAIDGYSRKVVGFIIIPVKNAVLIYDKLFRPLLLTQGVWSQLRTDRGREFDLILAVQNSLRELRRHTDRLPYKRTQSIHNLRAERFWVYVNQRVNYPLKAALRSLESCDRITLTEPAEKFCVSWVAMQVANAGVQQLIPAWNEHRIAGRRGGIPNVLAHQNNFVSQIPTEAVPQTEEAVAAFQQAGGNLTLHSEFGRDPLREEQELSEDRLRTFLQFHDPQQVFSEVIHGRYDSLCAAIAFAIDITQDLSNS